MTQDGKVREEIQTLLDTFIADWNAGEIEKACNDSYAKDGIYLEMETGRLIHGRDAILQYYRHAAEALAGLTFSIELKKLRIAKQPDGTIDVDNCTMVSAIHRYSFSEGDEEVDSGYVLEVYERDENGKLVAVFDAS